MKEGVFYKHKNNTDVVIFPLAVENHTGHKKVLVAWHNIANLEREPRPIGFIETIEVVDEQLPNWEEYPKMTHGYFEGHFCSEDQE